MKTTVTFLLFITMLVTNVFSEALGASRVSAVVDSDMTERLESIYILKKSMKELNVQLSVLNTALEIAKKTPSHKKIYLNSRKVADTITALTLLGGAIASYHFKNEVKVVKIATFIGGISTSTSVLTSLMADLSTDEAEALQAKIDDLGSIIKASNINLNREIKLLCKVEPSNQMCL
ncbi:MAG: hypothetical protein H7281_12190 [Bacteriovorax sp.]|nr:hypothetical protein [Bacteriovorax sp.]